MVKNTGSSDASKPRPRVVVLDTNVLMHNPHSIFSFEEHHVFIPMMVLTELNRHKKGVEEQNRNARLSANIIDELMIAAKEGGHDMFKEGVPINLHRFAKTATGRIFFQDMESTIVPPAYCGFGDEGDCKIAQSQYIMQNSPNFVDHDVVIVTLDTLMHATCLMYDIKCEKYFTNSVLRDSDIFDSGVTTLNTDYFDGKECSSEWNEDFKVMDYILPPDSSLLPGTMIINEIPGEFKYGMVRESDERAVVINPVLSYFEDKGGRNIMDMHAKNVEQNFLLNACLNPDRTIVAGTGEAGTGKTLMALLAGLQQVIEEKRYDKIVVTRAFIPKGRDLGFLPGDVGQKTEEWKKPFTDNLHAIARTCEVLRGSRRGPTEAELRELVEFEAITYMTGRTFHDQFIIVDESQNLTPQMMRDIVARAGEGSKVVVLGNIEQIDTSEVNAHTCGLSFLIDRFRGYRHFAHVMLKDATVRSPLAAAANERLNIRK